jgi:hypothetical protein
MYVKDIDWMCRYIPENFFFVFLFFCFLFFVFVKTDAAYLPEQFVYKDAAHVAP